MPDAPTLYSYHRETGELIGTVAPDTNPRRPAGWLHPAFTTDKAPPSTGTGESAVFSNGAWSVVADRRGETWWTAEGEPVVVTDLGDPATAGLLAEAPPVPRALWRETAQLLRRDFVLALVAGGILPSAEAVAAARGEWPATFDAFLANLDGQQQLEIQVEWASASQINRGHPMIDLLAAEAGLTAEQADTLFGYSA